LKLFHFETLPWPPLSRSKGGVAHLVRSLGLMPEFVSHDWHVQPSCQRPNHGPPKRREFSPGGNARMRIRLSSKPYKHTVRYTSRQSSLRTGFPDDFHIGKALGERGRESCQRQQVPHDKAVRNDKALSEDSGLGARIRATVWPSGRINATFGACRSEDRKLRKDPFGGPCFEGTLRKPCCFSE
jgi:hypothetical protein